MLAVFAKADLLAVSALVTAVFGGVSVITAAIVALVTLFRTNRTATAADGKATEAHGRIDTLWEMVGDLRAEVAECNEDRERMRAELEKRGT